MRETCLSLLITYKFLRVEFSVKDPRLRVFGPRIVWQSFEGDKRKQALYLGLPYISRNLYLRLRETDSLTAFRYVSLFSVYTHKFQFYPSVALSTTFASWEIVKVSAWWMRCNCCCCKRATFFPPHAGFCNSK